MILAQPPFLCRAEVRPSLISLYEAHIVTFGDFAVLRPVPTDFVEECSHEMDQPEPVLINGKVDKKDDASATPMKIDSQLPVWCRTKSKPVLQRANTVTLGDYLDPTYMDPALWKTMPMHLVELILSKVPFRDLVTMRRVFKYWNSLILSEGFSPPFVPALIMFARTPTVRKMMWERYQSVPEAKNPRSRWSILRLWTCARRILKRKPSTAHGRGNAHFCR